MSIYLNKGNEGFRQSRNSEYVDKSELIGVINSTLFTENCFTCVTRCRRFGKSMAAKMLAAYYDKSCDSHSLFSDLKIANDPSFEKHLNKYPVIAIDMGDFVSRFNGEDVVANLKRELMADILEAYPQVSVKESDDIMTALLRIASATGERFVFIIDEWDAICREFAPATKQMDEYVDWLRRMFKSMSAANVFAGVYLTGILPIKKYNTQSALNNFAEYSMVSPGKMAGYFGFTKPEVKALAEKFDMDFDELVKWYDGYQIGAEPSMFNPNSVMTAIREHWCESYWGKTGTANAVANYIKMNFDGLRDNIIKMLAGERCSVDPKGFTNDLSEICSRDDVLTVLIHLGYLAYDRYKKECYIPNMEVAGEMEIAIRDDHWQTVVNAIGQSKQLLQATLDGESDTVARLIDAVHDDNTSILSYNDENSLACVISLAYYYARNDYIIHRELPMDKAAIKREQSQVCLNSAEREQARTKFKGFADIVLIPRKNVDSPAIVVELKYNKDADTAISQIKRKQYPAKLSEYTDRLLLVGISYDKKTKAHTCVIE